MSAPTVRTSKSYIFNSYYKSTATSHNSVKYNSFIVPHFVAAEQPLTVVHVVDEVRGQTMRQNQSKSGVVWEVVARACSGVVAGDDVLAFDCDR